MNHLASDKRKLQLRNPEQLEPRIAPTMIRSASTHTQAQASGSSDPLFNLNGSIGWHDLDKGVSASGVDYRNGVPTAWTFDGQHLLQAWPGSTVPIPNMLHLEKYINPGP